MQILASVSNTLVGDDASLCARDVVEHLPAVMNFVRRHMRSRRAKGMSVPQFRVLVRVEREASLSDVACFLGTTLPTASRIVSGLVAKGFLRRVPSEVDRRCCLLSLTHRGEVALRDAWEGTRQAVAVELRRLPATECRKIAASLRAVGPLFATEAPV